MGVTAKGMFGGGIKGQCQQIETSSYQQKFVCPYGHNSEGGGSEHESSLYGSGLKVLENSTGA